MIQVKDTSTAWWIHEQAGDYTSAVGSSEWATEIYWREASGGNGGENDCEPSDLADGQRRLIFGGYREEAGAD